MDTPLNRDLLRLLIGVAGTWVGAELLVRGSARLALALGLRPLLVGLTVVAFGTSSPEAVVSFVAAANRSAGIAVGNVVGSNIANIGLILGLVSVVHPMQVNWADVRRDVLFMLVATLVSSVAILAGWLQAWMGLLLWVLLVVSLVFAIREPAPLAQDPGADAGRVGHDARTRTVAILQALVGLLLLVGAARVLVGAAQQVAREFGIEEAVIGATVVAVGTSIPELAASLVAVARGHYAIGIGNLVGSNLMNLTFVLATVCFFPGVGEVSADVARVLVPAMLLFTVLFVPMLATGGRVRRLEGAALLTLYAVFSWLVYF